MPDKTGILQYASTLIYKQYFTIADFVKHMAVHCANMEVYNVISQAATRAFGALSDNDLKAIVVHYEVRGPEFVIVLSMGNDVGPVTTGQLLGEIRTLLNDKGQVTTILNTMRYH